MVKQSIETIAEAESGFNLMARRQSLYVIRRRVAQSTLGNLVANKLPLLPMQMWLCCGFAGFNSLLYIRLAALRHRTTPDVTLRNSLPS